MEACCAAVVAKSVRLERDRRGSPVTPPRDQHVRYVVTYGASLLKPRAATTVMRSSVGAGERLTSVVDGPKSPRSGK